jgi:exopolysaccharide biosynthesis WecB/TagA/CpsF family protein
MAIKIQNIPIGDFISKKHYGCYNFINMNTIWWLKNSSSYLSLLSQENNINFTDGRILSFFLHTKQQRGPSFTRQFLTSELAKNKKHFFIGLDSKDKELLSKKIGIKKNISAYNPSYIKEIEFTIKERNKMVRLIKSFKPDFIWVCVGSPKQEILANQLFIEYPKIYFSVGAATDFILGKKKESPVFFRKCGLEWFYRLITDFKYSKKKVWRSLVGMFYLNLIEMQK